MTCPEFRHRYSEWRDGTGGELDAAVAAHLLECTRCATHHAALEAGVRTLAASAIAPTRTIRLPDGG
jgi:hypothetical protein